MKLYVAAVCAVLAITSNLSQGVRIAQSAYSVVHPVRPAGHSPLYGTSSNSNPFYSFKNRGFSQGGGGGAVFGAQTAKFIGGGPSLLSYGNLQGYGAGGGGYGGGGYGGGRYGGLNFGGIKQKTCGIPPTHCDKLPFRTLTGACNHLSNPGAGMAGTTYSRLLTAKYADGVSAPTRSVTGEDLPNARLISLHAFGDRKIEDPKYTIYNMQWGQIMTHDMSLQFGGSQAMKHATRCCTDDNLFMPQESLDVTCYPIPIPHTDPHHLQTSPNAECINFVRTLTNKDLPCQHLSHSHQAEQLTEVTSYLDLSNVYGNSVEQNAAVRAFRGGRLATEVRHGFEWPLSAANASASCDPAAANEVCYAGADSRFNQNPGLTSIQIMLMRKHNQIADALLQLNPHWDDERCFQEARKINIAAFQHISYYEWLPIFLGEKNMKSNGLIYDVKPGSYVNDFNENIDPRIINSFATAAFRYFHSQIEGRLDLLSEHRARTNSLRMSDWFNRPIIVETEFDNLNRGMVTQPEQDTDKHIDPEVKHFLFRQDQPFGMDLKALDIQRNRDHGLASYNDFREFCGLKRAHSWEGFLDLITPASIAKLQSLYVSHEDVDLTVGAALEAHVAGALAGPTFLCILTEQFFRTRVGDRFFFENGDPHTGFTREQLDSIRRTSAARLVCDTSNNIQTIQPRAFERINHDNQLQPCVQLPDLDINLWREEIGGLHLGGGPHHHQLGDEASGQYTSFLYKK